MKEFLLVFRGDYKSTEGVSPEQLQASTQKWMNWIGSIAAQNKLVDRGNRLEGSGKVLKGGGSLSDGPFTELKESIMGYTLIKTESIQDAEQLCKECPIFSIGGSVEIRQINKLQD